MPRLRQSPTCKSLGRSCTVFLLSVQAGRLRLQRIIALRHAYSMKPIGLVDHTLCTNRIYSRYIKAPVLPSREAHTLDSLHRWTDAPFSPSPTVQEACG